ncbi:hypothetical protein Daura_31415 [Dactylosporangium aurantiacum]|uniref:Uncharacterized protein n=1 Tax=Dactylosporangium aurantiacum TaxID=35754 RepID=A0A9Q9IEV6_9ACTN|nr:hypothetical protein [Dactylosporangium aurantiacum]MDG6107210.1 hypothetical protein [Dactylosporangium aurantiacum]UWZ51255.1 hypothetical protein Daura_31415 [Dactylosporangium aurantiacum]
MQWELFGFGLVFVVVGVALATNAGGIVTRCVTVPPDLAASVSRFRPASADRERDAVRTARLIGILAAVAGLGMTVSVLWR